MAIMFFVLKIKHLAHHKQVCDKKKNIVVMTSLPGYGTSYLTTLQRTVMVSKMT